MEISQTFLDGLDALAQAGDARGFTFVYADGGERTLGWRTLHGEVFARGRKLLAAGLCAGETEELIIVAETADADPETRRALATRVKTHLTAALSLVAADVVLLGPGELSKTTSGKLQRHKTREQYLTGTLAQQGVRLASTGG